MASTSVTYSADGVTTDFPINFPFIQRDHVKVYVDTIEMATPLYWSWVTDSLISFVDPPAFDSAVVIRRETPGDTRLVNFQNGAVLTEADLDLSADQNFYIAQESYENYAQLVLNELMRIGTPNGIVETTPDAIIAGLVEKMLEDASAATLQTRVNDIDANAEAILTLSTGLQVQINTLAQGIAALVWIQATAPVPGVGGVPDPIPDGSRWYDSDDNNAPYIYNGSLLQWDSIADPRIGQAVADISVLQTNVSDNAAAVVAESVARSNADSATASTIALIGAQNGAQTAFIIDLNTVQITDGVESLADRFSSLSASIGTNSADILTEQTTRADADSATAATIALMGAKNAGSTAFILDSATVKVDSDAGETMADKFTTVAANDVAVTTHASAISDLEGRYGVTITSGTYITGFSLNNSGTSSEFAIMADKFAIVEPGTLDQKIWWDGVGSTLQIDGDVLVSGSVTSNELTGSGLSDLYAGMGAITSGTITLNTSGHIKGGATGFETGAGFWLGYDSPDHKFYIGDEANGQYMSWDGSVLTVRGEVVSGEYYHIPSPPQIAVLSWDVWEDYSGAWVERKKYVLDRPGSVFHEVTGKVEYNNGAFSSTVTNSQYRTKVNGVVKSTRTVTSTTGATTQDTLTTLEAGDVVTVEMFAGQYNNGSGTVATRLHVTNVAIKANIIHSAGIEILDDL